MTKLEKVIKGLECWSNGARQCDNDCPYRPSIERMSVVGVCDIPQFCKDALELLIKQEDEISEAKWYKREEVPEYRNRLSVGSEMILRFREGLL